MAESISARVAWKLKKAIVGRPAKGTSNTGTASFVRTDESGVGWVRLPGADTDTPINGNLVTDMKPGDIVSYRIDGGRLSVMGNVTSPSVGRSVVRAITEEVQEPLRVEVSKARAENASTLKVATEAQTVANATGQHFWEDESGIHVTEATQADWNDTSSPSYHSGPNILINSLGQLLRNGINNLVSITASAVAFYDGLGNAAANVVAQFGADGAQIGRTGESHVSVTQNSFSLLDKHSDSYFAAEGMADMKVMSLYSTTIKTPPSVSAIDTRKTVSWQSATGQGINDLAKYDADDIVSYDLYLDGELVESDPDEMTETFSGTFATGSLALRLSLGDLQPSTTYTVRVMVRVYDEEVTLPTVRIGAEDKSHISLDYHSLKLVDKEGNTYFYVSDLRGQDGTAEMVAVWKSDGTTTQYTLSVPAVDTSYSVTVSDSSGTISSKGQNGFTFSVAPNRNATITATYTTNSSLAKALTFGIRYGSIGAYSVAEGSYSEASGTATHAEGSTSHAAGFASHAEGRGYALGDYSHAESGANFSISGVLTTGTSEARGKSSHAEGGRCVADGDYSHAEGRFTNAEGLGSHAEGGSTTASGYYAHAEGGPDGSYTGSTGPVASGAFSHAEGADTVASGNRSHAEGYKTTASGYSAHTEGTGTAASGMYAHAQNLQTRAGGEAQTAIGKYNANDPDNAFEIGNGFAEGNRSNAFAVDWNGNATAYGNLIATNFRDVAMSVDLGSTGTVHACRIGSMLVMSGSLVNCTVSDTYTWTHLAHLDPEDLGITSVTSMGAMVDVNGGGPSYYGSTNGGGTARIVDGVLYADMQTNAAFSNRFVKFLITAYVE